MKWLLWKDYRQNRPIVVAAVLFLLTPHLVALSASLAYRSDYRPVLLEWKGNFALASVFSLVISQLAIAVIGGNAIAGERVDRSAEFLASLPVSRGRIVTSKLLLALAIIAVIWLSDASVMLCLAGNSPQSGPDPQEAMDILKLTAITASVFFSVAWLLSSFLTSPTIPVCGGLFTPVLVWLGSCYVDYLFELHVGGEALGRLYCLACLILAPVCFAIGTWHYLRRVEP